MNVIACGLRGFSLRHCRIDTFEVAHKTCRAGWRIVAAECDERAVPADDLHQAFHGNANVYWLGCPYLLYFTEGE